MKYLAVLMIVLGLTVNAQAGESVNLLVNSSMEQWHPSGLRPFGWGVWTNDNLRRTWKVLRDDQMAVDGRTSMVVKLDGDWANAYASADVQPGQTYTFSIYVRCDQPVKLGLKFDAFGAKVAREEQEIKRKQVSFDITPGKWQRVSVTDTMPAGTERAVTYLLLKGQGTWHFDAAMLTVGKDSDVKYVPGPTYHPIAPLNQPTADGQIAFTPRVWDKQDHVIDDQEVAFAFDTDLMSDYRLRNDTAAIGAIFAKPVQVRGLYILLQTSLIPQDVKMKVQGKINDQWTDLPDKVLPIGVMSLLAIDPVTVTGIRLHVDTPRKLLRIYHLGFAQ